MLLPITYLLPALDGESLERAAVLQEIRDRGIVEASDLTEFCFKVEALLDDHETQSGALKQDLLEAHRDLEMQIETTFDELCIALPDHADLLHVKRAAILEKMK
jgi:fructosamine-3-kinase